jgi:RHS repeat-associated protein
MKEEPMFRLRFAVANILLICLALLLPATVAAQGPTGDVIISTNTSWPTANYNVTSLTVKSGAVLTIGGGSSVTAANGITVSGNSSIVLQATNTTAQVNGTWQGAGVTIQAGSVQVDAGSSINADGQGYISDAGPGFTGGAGGSYGGGGGGGYVTTLYGSAVTPVDLGSGGSNAQYGGSAGGGAIRLIVTGTLTLNGTISANGEKVEPSGGAAGSGGSVYVTTGTLSGSGTFTANGGANTTPTLSGSPAGGGGRVAIYYASAGSFTGFLNTTAAGGAYTGTSAGFSGSNGTAAFFDTSAANNKLILYQSFLLPANSSATYGQIAVQNGAVLTIGGGSTITVTGGITVTGNSTILLQATNTTAQVNGTWQGAGVTLNAGSLQVDAGSSINANGQGYAQDAGPGYTAGSGGSYGGLGGGGYAATMYGSAAIPVDLGSGGSNFQYGGSMGGGAIRLIVSGTLTLNGTISANGEKVEPSGGGAGSGGSVYVTTGTLAGAGSFTANGGSNTTPALSGAPAGGGGRVAIYYASGADFTGFQSSTATGGVFTGTATGNAGADGSAAFFDTTAPNSNVTVYHGYDFPANSSTQFNSFTVGNGASISVGGGAQIAVTQALTISGTITAQSINNQGAINKKYIGKGVTIAAGSLTVTPSGSINADGQGYINGVGPGAGFYNAGGSYGGLGGQQTDPTKLYGSATAPLDLGSGGGGGAGGYGANGGGAIELLVGGTFSNNGAISANGGSITNNGAAAGSGGSVYVQAHTVQGTGTITANGGSNTSPNSGGGGGGGGRIAVNYVIYAGLNQALVTANGGTGVMGSAGTVKFIQAPALLLLKPSVAAVHGQTTVQWFSDAGNAVTVSEAGPQSSTLTVAPTGFGSVTWDTTAVPDGAYELRLVAVDTNGNTDQLSKNVVVNNSVKWFSGTLTANTHWTANNVYGIDADLIIPSGITLTVDPGTVVKALAGTQIRVQSGGTLVAIGTTGNPVIFTTFDDSSVGGNTDFNQGVSTPVPGEWGGIIVDSGGTFTNNSNTLVRYAGQLSPLSITSDTTFASTQTYEINGTLTVSNNATLTIQPGAVVKFDSGAGINMQAGTTLIANGTLTQPIYFTSTNDNSVGGNTNNNSGGTPPAPGDWNAIAINGGNASFNYVTVEYGGGPTTAGVQGMIETGGAANITIANSVLAYSYNIGVDAGYGGGGGTTTVTNTTFYGNQDRSVNAFGGAVHVVNSTFDSNAYGVEGHGGNIDVANSIFSNSIGTHFATINSAVSVVNTDVYTTAPGVTNYAGITDPTGTNGNISADPVYMNAALHDYRPTYGSPAIDAASAAVPNYPATDAYGFPRINSPLVINKKGTPDSNGHYPDIGAFEFAQNAPSNLDLTVTAVQGPPSATVGSQVQLTWTVTNVGSGTVYGPWHDAVYVVTDPGTNPVEVLAGQFLEGVGIVLGPGATYSASATVTVPGTTAGPHVWEVKTNVRGEVFEGANTGNNKAISLQPVSIGLNQLITGAAPLAGTFTSIGQTLFFEFTPGASQATKIQLALNSGVSGSVQLFVGGDYIPTPQRYDYQQTEFNSPSASVVIPSGTAQMYYVAAYAQSLLGVPAGFSIQATAVQFALTNVSPNTAVAHGTATLTFTGGGFTSSTVFALVGPNGTSYAPASIFITDSDHAELTFNLSGFASGTYTASASNGAAITLANALTVSGDTTGGGGGGTQLNEFRAVLRTPEGFRAGFPSIVTLDYTNASDYDIAAPLVYVSATNGTLTELVAACNGCDPNLAQKHGAAFNSGLVLAINQQGPAGVLPAGASGSITFLAKPAASGSMTFFVQTVGIDPVAASYQLAPISCGGPVGSACAPPFPPTVLVKSGYYLAGTDFCSSLVPPSANAEGYDRSCMALLNNAGFAYTPDPFTFLNSNIGKPVGGLLRFQQFNNLLAADATALSKSGIYEYDVQSLIAYELQKDGSAVLSTRYHQGAFGFGPSHPFDITLVYASGSATVSYPDGSTRVFTAAFATQPNLFLGSVGDYGTLTVQNDGSYLLTEADGTVSHFSTSTTGSVLDYVKDRAGNKTVLSYTNNLVTGVADAFGNTLQFQYDGLGHITQATDPAGRVTTYGYNTLNDAQHSTFLTSTHDSTGTTTITWNQGGSHGVGYFADSCVTTYCEPAISITSVAYPDGTHSYYTYDVVGRLTSSYGDGGAETTTFTYNSDGSVKTTDALGKSLVAAPNQVGSAAAITDALGTVIHFKYDPEYKLLGVVGALGDSAAASYDQYGNIASVTSPIGNLTNLAYTGDQAPSSVTDPSGNMTSFGYDSAFDLTSTTYPNTQKVNYTYDTQGRPLSRTNLRGQTVTFTYGAHNLLASKTFSNGSTVQYSYDSHFNLQSSTTAAGVTRYAYDAADRLTTLTNPDGTSLTFTYNANGQRTSMRDSTNFVTNYTYDAAGRLASLNSGTGASIVLYAYDANGRLATKTFGNGTSTSLAYDANGQPISIIHYSPSHAILSEYDYTYDTEGHPVTMKAPTGTLTYGYDLDGQLTSVTTPAGVTQYNYDPSGNRSSVASGASTSAYLVNNLNEYTSVNGNNYLYDADGNLTSGNGWIYTYNDENKLLTMVSATDSWSFQYDGLGNRVASVHNGRQARYLIDPEGFGNVEAEFDNTGAVIAHYTYGLDLTSSVQATGATGFYHFDAAGNTTQITNASGAVANSYVYLPFGEQTVLSASIPNAFTYDGQDGVRDEGSGLYFMRNRWYNPQLGRFQQQDPIGLQGGQNLYEYVLNSPLSASDPTGTIPSPDYYTAGGGFGIVIGVQVNAHNGETFLSIGVTPGAGVNAAAGKIVNTTAEEKKDIGATTSDHLGGFSGNVSAYNGGGGGFTKSADHSSLEAGVGFGGRGGSINYAVSTYSADVVGGFQDLNRFTGGRLFNASPYSSGLVGGFQDLNRFTGGRLFGTGPVNGTPPVRQIPNPCGPCLFNPAPGHIVPINGAVDPNAKITSGFGNQGFIPVGEPITYTIYFENQPTATAPAQKVIVTDALSSNLDWSTVQLTQISFNNTTISVPEATQTYAATAYVSTDANPVSVSSSLNPTTGVLNWTMQSVDAITGAAPANPLAGFLPPNNAANAGTGFVTFSVQPKKGLGNGTVIPNQASVVFDANAAINTNTVTNTIDSSTPTSAVSPLPSSTTAASFTVSWTGSDPSGSGIATYNIYVAIDGATPTLWLSGTTLTSSTYTATPGHTYSFFSLATNNVGVAQTAPGTPQIIAVTYIVPTVTVTPSAMSISPTQPLTVNVAVTSTGPITVTGSVTLQSGAYASGPATLAAGVVSFTIPAGTLPTGMDTLTATYTPDTADAFYYSAATGTASVTVVANTSILVSVSASGAAFSVDGTNYTTPQTFTWISGSNHTLATTTPQTASGVQQTFVAWSDGGALSHSVTASATVTSYTASFSTAYLLTTAASPVAGGTVSPVTGTYYPTGTTVNLLATPAPGYTFVNWTGPVANSSAASTTITLNAPQTVTANFILSPAPIVAITPAALTFTSISGVTSAAQTVQLKNTGNATLTLASVTIAGSNPTNFAQTNTCGTSIAAGATCTISATFTSSAVGTFSATLTVADNVAGSPQTVPLSGTATTPPTFSLSATPASQTVSAGGSVTYNVTATAQGGGFTTAVNLTVTGLPAGATATFAPSTVTPGAVGATSVLTIQTAARSAELRTAPWSANAPVFAVLGFFFLTLRRPRRWAGSLLALLLIVIVTAVSGCGSGNSGPQASTSLLTITGTSGSASQTTTVSLTIE